MPYRAAGWLETSDIGDYTSFRSIGARPLWVPISLAELDADPNTKAVISKVRFYFTGIGAAPYSTKFALYDQTYSTTIVRPVNLLQDLGEDDAATGYYEVTLPTPYTTKIGTILWAGLRTSNSGLVTVYNGTVPAGAEENKYVTKSVGSYTDAWDNPVSTGNTTVSTGSYYVAVYVDQLITHPTDTATGTDSVAVTVSTSVSDTGEGTDTPGPAAPSLPDITDTGEGTDAVAMVSQAATVGDTGEGADAVSLGITIPTIEDTATGTDSVARGDTGFFVTDTAHGADSVLVSVTITIADTAEGAESLLAPLKTVYDFGGVSYIPGAEGERVVAPIFVVTDTATGTDSISLVIAIADTATGVDAVSVTRGVITIADTATGVDAILITGQDPVTPPDAGTGGLEALHVLKLILGDKRNPTRELNLAQTGDGNIFLRTTGHTLGSGEANVLWSGQSYRFDGQKKIAESRDNAQLTLAYDLTAGSAAGVSAAQRQINRFFLDAKRYNEDGEGLPVYLVYRWSDNLGSLPEPAFGQLNYYWEVYHADVPRWPENIHDGRVVTGNVEEVVLNLVTSPYPEGMEQQAGFAYGAILDTHGVRLNSGDNSFLRWSYSSTALLGQFTVEGWFTVYWGTISDDRTILHILAGTSSLKIIYEGANNYFRITKIVGGTTYTDTSDVMALEDGDHVHVAAVQDADTLRLYVNGVEAASVGAALFGSLSASVNIRLATNPTGPDGIDAAVDGWRIFDEALTATQAAALYNAELEVKTLGETVGPPACFDTNSPEQSLLTFYRAYATVIGIAGDVEARARWLAAPGSGGFGVWAGRRASRAAQATPPYLVNFNGDSYTSVAPSEGTRSYVAAITTPDMETLEGRFACLAWLSNRTAGGSATVKAGITLTDNVSLAAIKSDGVTVSYDSGYWNVYNLGEIYIRSRDRSYQPPGAIPFIEFTDVSGSPTFYIDYMLLLPWPYMGLLKAASESSVTYVFNHEQPYGYSSNGFVSYPEVIGVPVTLLPGQYNYVYFLQHQQNAASGQWATFAPLNLYVTPRFLLPGGLIA